MLTHLADAFTAASILAGLWAAGLWWRSGRVPVQLPPGLDDSTLEGLADRRRWDAFGQAARRTETLNSHAAIWTAVSVAAQAVATVLGRFGSG